MSQAFAAPGAGDAKFLLVFLRGGYDAANVVIPVGSPFYYESRPTIAIPKPESGQSARRRFRWPSATASTAGRCIRH